MSGQDKRRNNADNRHKIVEYIARKGEVSKADIAADLALSMPTILGITKKLQEDGIIQETGVFASTGGRRAKKFMIVSDRNYAVGVDITANHITMAALNLRGDIVHKNRMREKFQNTLEYYEMLCQHLDDFLKDCGIADEEKVLGVGISFPGIVDKENEILVRSHALQVTSYSLRNVTQLFRFPVWYENDANSAALAEMRERQEEKNAVYLSLSNTVGGAVFVNGEIYQGTHYHSGEFGHMLLEPGGKKCYCGRNGCVDAYCSANVLSDLTGGDLALFFEKLDEGNDLFRKVWEEYLGHLVVAVSNLRMIFDCDVILGGYVGGYLETYMTDLRKRVLAYNLFDEDVTFVKNCKIKSEASAAGVALKFIDHYLQSF